MIKILYGVCLLHRSHLYLLLAFNPQYKNTTAITSLYFYAIIIAKQKNLKANFLI